MSFFCISVHVHKATASCLFLNIFNMFPALIYMLQPISHSQTRQVQNSLQQSFNTGTNWDSMQLTANSVLQGEGPKSLSSTRLRKDQMLCATAVELQALPTQPLDGNNSLLHHTITVASIYCMLCLILCTVLSFAIMPIQIILFMDSLCMCLCVFRETILPLVHPWSTCPLLKCP